MEGIEAEINGLRDQMLEINEQIITLDNHKMTMDQEYRRADLALAELAAT